MGALQMRSFYPLINIYIAWHGETTWNVEGRIQGRSDPDLSPKGYAQSLALFERLKGRPLSAIYTSTLKRSVLTAQPIANHFGLPIQRQPELDEIAFGILEGKLLFKFDEELKGEWERFKDHRFTYHIPGGENYTDVANRIKPFMERTLRDHEGQEALIVGHRVVNRLLIGMLMEYPLEWVLKIEQTNDCIYLIHRNEETKIFHYINGKIREGILLVGEEVIL
jgi:alpha-ribazole phosphatase